MNSLPVVEVFGPTLQGEGPAAGRNAAFLRLGGCNLSCSWCDSSYTWNGAAFNLRQQIRATTVPDIMAQLPDSRAVVLTGGEPLLHESNPAWPELLDALAARYVEMYLETNGTLRPSMRSTEYFRLISVSPKLANAGPHRGQQNPEMHPGWVNVRQAFLKVVVRSASDVDDAVALSRRFNWEPHRTWVMPEGIDALVLGERWPEVASAAAKHGINASHRLHVLAWNDERGH